MDKDLSTGESKPSIEFLIPALLDGFRLKFADSEGILSSKVEHSLMFSENCGESPVEGEEL